MLKKCVLIGFVMVFLCPIVFSSIGDLIGSYNYDFSDGSLNITEFKDFMKDINLNGINDTLIFNLSVFSFSDEDYYFIVGLDDGKRKISNYTFTNVTTESVLVFFDSKILNSNSFNYSVEVRDESFGLVFAKYGLETGHYEDYERGILINSISDFSVNDNFVRFVLDLNVSENREENISFYLEYENQTIFVESESFLSSPNCSVVIDLDNETLKRTHYNGSFLIEDVQIGDKVFFVNYTTSVYDYEDFAKSSYVREVLGSGVDLDRNSLYDFFEINFSLVVLKSGFYDLGFELVDEEGNFILRANESKDLDVGETIWSFRVNGSEIYELGYDGSYFVGLVELFFNSEVVDVLFDREITDYIDYLDFERPLLADLNVEVEGFFNDSKKETEVSVLLSNNGNAGAFSVFLGVFGIGESFEESVVFLDAGEEREFLFSFSNSTNSSEYFFVADLDGLVDEGDETNNVVSFSVGEFLSRIILDEIGNFNVVAGERVVVTPVVSGGVGDLILSIDNMNFYKEGNSFIWDTLEGDEGNYYVTITATDSDGNNASESFYVDVIFVPECYSNSDCDDGLFCTGAESCSAGVCVSGNVVDCSPFNIGAVGQCDYNPDNNPFTWDYFAGFISTCDESTDRCTQSSLNIVSTIDIDRCGAECLVDSDCDDGLFCNGVESCSAGQCIGGSAVDCSAYDLGAVGECGYDDNLFTWDYFAGFVSTCNEATKSCIQGSVDVVSNCDSRCGAACSANDDCPVTDCDYMDGCVGNDYYDYSDVSNFCNGCSCSMNSCSEPVVYDNDLRCITEPICFEICSPIRCYKRCYEI